MRHTPILHLSVRHVLASIGIVAAAGCNGTPSPQEQLRAAKDKWTGGTRQDDQPGERPVLGRDPRSQCSAKAVTQHEHACGIEAIVRPQQGRGESGIIGCFFADRQVRVPRHLAAMLTRPFLIPQDGDAAIGQTPGEIAERLVRSHGFVPIVRSRAVNQNNRRRNLADRH